MKITPFISASALAALLLSGPSFAQDQKRDEGSGMPQKMNPPSAPQKSEQPGAPKADMPAQQNPANRAQKSEQAPPNKQAEPKAPQGNAPRADRSQDTPQKQVTPGKQSPDAPKNAETPRAGQPGNDKQSSSDMNRDHQGKAGVQLSEKQRVDVHKDVLGARDINRVNVKIQVRVGERVPRDVRLAVLPASVVAIAPEYRSYRYFVVDDRVVIVEPKTFEILDVIVAGGPSAQTALKGLSLSNEERMIVMREVDVGGGDSTLGIGALSEGAMAPRNVKLMALPQNVVDLIPRLQGFRYFVAEQRVGLVDQPGTIQALIDVK